MAAKKRRRRRSPKKSKVYKVMVRRWKGGRYQTELYGMSIAKRDAIHHFNQAADNTRGYVALHEDTIIKERSSKED